MSPAAHPALQSASPDELARIAERVRPLTLADEQLLPVLDALTPLVPWGGLARGTTLACTGIGATSLTLSLAAGASGQGAWTVAVGLPDLGLAAASELGIDLRRFCSVGPPPADQWASVIGALVGAFDLVVVRPAHRVRPGDARRLVARARERGTVLLVVDPASSRAGWPEVPDLQLAITRVAWEGLGQGHGHLEARRVRVETTGRGRASRPRTADLWLLDPDGQVTPVERHGTVVGLRSGERM
jgi:hypothetical protein